jgi:hypothetical protein
MLPICEKNIYLAQYGKVRFGRWRLIEWITLETEDMKSMKT